MNLEKETYRQLKLCKYVVVEDGAGRRHPLVFSNSITHRDVVPAGMKATSAGFVVLLRGGLHLVKVGSESLGIGPGAEDQEILDGMVTI